MKNMQTKTHKIEAMDQLRCTKKKRVQIKLNIDLVM